MYGKHHQYESPYFRLFSDSMSVRSPQNSAMNRGRPNGDISNRPDHLPPPSTRGGQHQPHPPSNSHQQQNHQQQNQPANQIVHSRQFALDQLISNQGSIRRDVLRHDESVQAVRQENIMLAEKVQHATNLYRQLLNRVGKTEERMDMENKSMSNILSQAKQVETQLVNQQERLTSKEAQLHMQVQKLQEEMSILKVEREQMKKSNHGLTNDIRQLQEKLTRQSGTLSTGLSDLKAHLDQKDLEKHQSVSMMFNELREKVDNQEHNMSLFQTQMEGRLETIKLKSSQMEKQEQDSIYQIHTMVREKEALAKADVRKLQESFRDVFEEFSKSVAQKDTKTRQELDGRIEYIERKLGGDSKALEKKFRELEQDAVTNIKTMKNEIAEDIKERNQSRPQSSRHEKASSQDDEMKQQLKSIEKQTKQNKHDIEKVVRAEIQSRISQGDKLSRQVADTQKDHHDALTLIQDTLGDHKRKNLHAIEEAKRDLLRMINEINDREDFDVKRKFEIFEQKIDEIEDALDEFAKQDERIEMNSERVKQIEMENILSQGDLSSLVESCNKHIRKVDQEWKDKLEEVVRQIERERNKTPRPNTAVVNLREQVKQLMSKYDIMPSQIKLVERKLHYLAEGVEDYKKQQNNINTALSTNAGPVPRQGTPVAIKRQMMERLEVRIDNMKVIMNVLKDVLTDKVNDEHTKNKRDKLLKELKRKLDELNIIAQKAAEDEDNDEVEDDEDEEEDSEEEGEEDGGEEEVEEEDEGDEEEEDEDEEDEEEEDVGVEEEEEEDEEDDEEENGVEEEEVVEEEEDEEDEEDDEDDEEDDEEDEEDEEDEDDDRPSSSRSSVLELALSRENSMVPVEPTPPGKSSKQPKPPAQAAPAAKKPTNGKAGKRSSK